MKLLLTFISIIAVAWGAVAHGAADPATAEARKHFQEGSRLYKLARYREAVAEFEAAYRARPHGVVLFNIAQCQEKLGDIPAALKSYEAYLREVPNAQDRATVEAVIANLRERIAQERRQKLEITSRPPGASVAVDGKVDGTTPFSGTYPLGEHRVDVSLQGFEPKRQQVLLEAQGPAQLLVTLTPEAPAPPPASTAAAAPTRRWTWIAAGTAGAALAGAVTLGLLARSNERALRDGTTRPQADADRLYQGAQTEATAANVCYGVAGVAAAAGGALFFVEGRF